MTTLTVKPQPRVESAGSVNCPICTRTVDAIVIVERRGMRVKLGQKCPRCSSSLDAGYVMDLKRAAA